MNNTLDEGFILSNDLDWYATNGVIIAHFATGGTDTLPCKVKNNKENWNTVCNFFDNLKEYSDIQVQICIENIPLFNSNDEKERYLYSFIKMAKKGLYSYDIDFDSLNYNLIAYPKNINNIINANNVEIATLLPIIELGNKVLTKNFNDI